MIAKEILRSQGRRRLKDLPKILDGRILIQETKLNIVGKAAWAGNIKKCKDKDFFSGQLVSGSPRQHKPPDSQVVEKRSHFLRCTSCTHWVGAERTAFDAKNLASKTWYGVCKKSWPVRDWLWKCSEVWHNCPSHAGAPQAARAMRAHQTLATKSSRRKDGDKGGLESKSSRARLVSTTATPSNKRNSDIKFSDGEIRRTRTKIQRSFLSCGLKRKFSHLLQGRL